jgi:acetyltransferase-like isoleucine patch superfamily enzyme
MEQNEYLKLLVENRIIVGEYDANKVSGLSPMWFWFRRVRLIDFRGDLQIRSAENITFGFDVSIYTASHTFWEGGINPALEKKRVWIDDAVFVGSGSILYNCHLQHHALVSIGSVVRNMVVPPYCMVEGNPAMIVREYRDGRWRHTENCQI